jgi:hypothetical protein
MSTFPEALFDFVRFLPGVITVMVLPAILGLSERQAGLTHAPVSG